MSVAERVVRIAPHAGGVLRTDRGDVLPLHVDRWFAEPSLAEWDVLDHALEPVLDIGCGPARHTLALLAAGIRAVGVDAAPGAVAIARGRGAPVLHRSVFDRLPDEGCWGTALLLDGNVGIGGNPSGLLRRVRRLLRAGGRALVEVEGPGVPTGSLRVRFDGSDPEGGWFRWGRVSADRLDALARATGFALADLWSAEGRWFGRLDA